MREYELTVVFSPEIADENVGSEIERVSQFVTQKGGSISAEPDRWGRRRLAYPIRRFREGNYVLNHIRLEPSQVAELEKSLLSSEGILRHLLVRLGD